MSAAVVERGYEPGLPYRTVHFSQTCTPCPAPYMLRRGHIARRAPGARLEPDGGDVGSNQLQAAHERGHRQREQRREAQRAQLALQRAADRIKPARSGQGVSSALHCSHCQQQPQKQAVKRQGEAADHNNVMLLSKGSHSSSCNYTLSCPHRSSHRSTNASSAASGPPPSAGPPFASGWDPGRACGPPLGMPAGGGAAPRKKASAASGEPGPSSSRAKMPHPALRAQQATMSAASP